MNNHILVEKLMYWTVLLPVNNAVLLLHLHSRIIAIAFRCVSRHFCADICNIFLDFMSLFVLFCHLFPLMQRLLFLICWCFYFIWKPHFSGLLACQTIYNFEWLIYEEKFLTFVCQCWQQCTYSVIKKLLLTHAHFYWNTYCITQRLCC